MADIQLDSITNDTGTGIFDKLMSTVNAQIETQYLNNRITGSDYANVYLTSLQSVLQQSVQYVMQEQLTEAQIDGIAADNLLKSKQLEIAEQELAIKLYELQNMMPAQLSQMQAQTAEVTDSTVRANTQLNDQLLTSTKQRTLLDTQEEAEQYKVDNLLPAELAQIQKQTDVAEREMVEQESTGSKQRLVLDKDIALKTYENTVLQSDQHNTNIAQQTLLATEEQAKQYEVDNILPANLAQIQKQTDVAERSIAEQELTGAKQRILLETEEEAKQYEVDNILPEQLSKIQEENKILSQKVVGKKQSTVIQE